MIREWIATPLVLAVIVMLITFGAMFGAKKWFLHFTKKIANPTVRRGVNVALGLATCFVISATLLLAFVDWFKLTFVWWTVVVSALGATGMYLILEKVFGEAKVNEAGKAVMEAISHSDLFDGKLTADGLTKFTKGLFTITNGIDKAVAEKEKVAVDKALTAIEGFMADGKITAEEQAQIEKMRKSVNLEGTETYNKYLALLNK